MATEPESPKEIQLPDANAAIRAKGTEFLLGYDIPRHWATGAQVFAAKDFSAIVFREQNLVQSESGEVEGLVRNVTSAVMPTLVLQELHEIIGRELERLGVASEK